MAGVGALTRARCRSQRQRVVAGVGGDGPKGTTSYAANLPMPLRGDASALAFADGDERPADVPAIGHHELKRPAFCCVCHVHPQFAKTLQRRQTIRCFLAAASPTCIKADVDVLRSVCNMWVAISWILQKTLLLRQTLRRKGHARYSAACRQGSVR